MYVQVSYKKQFLVYIFLLLILLFVIELGVKIFEWQHNTHPCEFIGNNALQNVEEIKQYQICEEHNSLAYKVDGVLRFIPNQHMETININSHGFRGPDFSEEKELGVFRIFLVGGSTVFGSASPDDTTISSFLQKKINNFDTGLKIEILNAGITSSYSYTEKYLIENHLIKFQPDLIIIYSGGNDSHNRFGTEYNTPVVLYDLTKTSSSFFEIVKKIIYDVNYRTPFLVVEFYHGILNNFPVSESSKNQVQELWTTRMAEVCKTNNDIGVKTMIFVQPMLGSGNKQLFASEKIELEKVIQQNKMNVTLEILNKISGSLDKLEDVCDKTSDFTMIFDNVAQPIYYDHLHTNYLGNEIIAEEIYEILTKHL
jgi:lysophospholipase L1-like esterase